MGTLMPFVSLRRIKMIEKETLLLINSRVKVPLKYHFLPAVCSGKQFKH